MFTGILRTFVQLKVIHNYELLIMYYYSLFIITPPTFTATLPRQKLEKKLGTKLEAKLETKLGIEAKFKGESLGMNQYVLVTSCE